MKRKVVIVMKYNMCVKHSKCKILSNLRAWLCNLIYKGSRCSKLGNVFYISVLGNDKLGEGTEMKPWLTIEHAISKCVSNNNDTVLVLPERYDEFTDSDLEGVSVNVKGITIKINGD